MAHCLRLLILILALTGTVVMASGAYALLVVQSGDTLGAIAQRYAISVDDLIEFNRLSSTSLHPGDLLKVPYVAAMGGIAESDPLPPPGFRWHILQPGETISSLMVRYNLSLAAIVGANPGISSLDRLPVGLELLIPPGEGMMVALEPEQTVLDLVKIYGVSPVALARANQIGSPADLRPGQLLFLPGVTPRHALDRLAEVRERENTYIWPVHGRLTSFFGPRRLGMGTSNFHSGLDIAAPTGTPVVAARAGTVTFAGWSNRGFGNLVKIRHAGGAETWYAHFSRILVTVGQQVRQGEVVGRIGSTGISTGPHLHFEVHEGGRPHDPLRFLR
ncbi:MAG: M23 family metallopeptidase [Truepera sp.]|nr:M23 family metallopeptidase [Truepera sp.]